MSGASIHPVITAPPQYDGSLIGQVTALQREFNSLYDVVTGEVTAAGAEFKKYVQTMPPSTPISQAQAATITMQTVHGTVLNPTPTLSGDQLAVVNAGGEDANGPYVAASVVYAASEAATPTTHGTLVTVATTPNGTVTPLNTLTVAAGASTSGLTVYGYNSSVPSVTSTRSNGSPAAPTAVTAGNVIATRQTAAYNGSSFVTGGQEQFVATENWTPAHSGTAINTYLTPSGQTGAGLTMSLLPGQLVLNTDQRAPGTCSIQETGWGGEATMYSYRNNGVLGAMTPLLTNQVFASWYGGGSFNASGSALSTAIAHVAAEDWTSVAQGSQLRFAVTPIGTIGPTSLMTFAAGNPAIGVPSLTVTGDMVATGSAGGLGCVYGSYISLSANPVSLSRITGQNILYTGGAGALTGVTSGTPVGRTITVTMDAGAAGALTTGSGITPSGKAFAANAWGTFVYTGTTWQLMASGSNA